MCSTTKKKTSVVIERKPRYHFYLSAEAVFIIDATEMEEGGGAPR
jgi:hypothetical protein